MTEEGRTDAALRLEPDAEGPIPALTVRHPDLADAEPATAQVSVLIAGDVWCPADASLSTEPEGVPWAPFTSLVNNHDVSVVNLEAPISPARAPAKCYLNDPFSASAFSLKNPGHPQNPDKNYHTFRVLS